MKPEEIVALKNMTATERAEYFERIKEKRIADHNEAFRKAEELKRKDMIAKKDLVDGAYYEGECRNAEVARWNGKQEVFIHWRTKWGQKFLEEIKHPDDEKHYDVFIAKKLIQNPTEEIPF